MKNLAILTVFAMFLTAGYGQEDKKVRFNKETNLIEATYFHDNGKVSQEGTFDLDGKLHGKWVKYDEKGVKISEGTYAKGLRTGKWTFISNGAVKEVMFANNAIANVTDRGNKASLVSKD